MKIISWIGMIATENRAAAPPILYGGLQRGSAAVSAREVLIAMPL
jgi:hypothetical protein